MDKKSIIVLGSEGMLGHIVLKHLTEQNFDVFGVPRKDFNAAYDNPHFSDNYEYIVNCIGIIKPNIKDNDPASVQNAILVNSLFPYNLSRYNPGAKIIQIATDCVVQGNIPDNQAYDESLISDAKDVYGKTKALGEVNATNVKNIRCSIIGPELKHKKSLLEWFLGQKDGAKLKGFTDHSWNGITTLAFAKVVAGIVSNDIQLPNIHHLVPAGEVTKYQLLQIFNKVFDKKFDIEAAKSSNSVNRKLSTLNSPLNTILWKAAGYNEIPTVEEMVVELKTYMDENKKIEQRH